MRYKDPVRAVQAFAETVLDGDVSRGMSEEQFIQMFLAFDLDKCGIAGMCINQKVVEGLFHRSRKCAPCGLRFDQLKRATAEVDVSAPRGIPHRRPEVF